MWSSSVHPFHWLVGWLAGWLGLLYGGRTWFFVCVGTLLEFLMKVLKFLLIVWFLLHTKFWVDNQFLLFYAFIFGPHEPHVVRRSFLKIFQFWESFLALVLWSFLNYGFAFLPVFLLRLPDLFLYVFISALHASWFFKNTDLASSSSSSTPCYEPYQGNLIDIIIIHGLACPSS